MLPKRERLSSSGGFRAVLARGRGCHGQLLSLHVLPRTSGPTRVGVSAGRKVGGAVQRNRAKRLLREAFRALRSRVNGPYYMVLVARPATAQSRLEPVRAEMEALMRRVRVLHQPAEGAQ